MARHFPPRRPRRLLTPEDYGIAEPEPLESEISGKITQALREIGAHVSSTQQRRTSRQTEGMPDLYATHAAWGVAAWLEVKRPGEKPSRVQREWHGATMAAGVPVLVVVSAADALRQFAALPRRSSTATANR